MTRVAAVLRSVDGAITALGVQIDVLSLLASPFVQEFFAFNPEFPVGKPWVIADQVMLEAFASPCLDQFYDLPPALRLFW